MQPSETYQIFGGDAVSLHVYSGDHVEIINVEGDQPCAVFAFDAKGSAGLDILTWQDKSAINRSEIVRKDCSAKLQEQLSQHKIVHERLLSAELFVERATAAARRLFEVNQDGLCVFSAHGGRMLVSEQNAPTEILINVSRIAPEAPSDLPSPLATPLRDIRVEKATARSYAVKKGEYIQIIDVAGHQCSDFQAFSQRCLKEGIENHIQPTVTRSLSQLSCPEPGVHNKFYDKDAQPLVEIIHDKVMRHDMLGLACNAKYYEDRGFPGHVNCTANFNTALAEHGVKARKGWIAVNFFFNTSIDDSHALASDVSWSRAGDYVLLKALTDVVCVSSACPDDTTPANNWNPTDIHIRIYDKQNNFSAATAFRQDPQSIPIMTKNTGFHSKTEQLTQNYSNYNGYWLPLEYNNAGAIKEYWQCREGVAIIDLSPLRKFEIYGPDAEALMQYAITRNVRKLAVGGVVYSAICYDNGCMIDDGTLFRLGQDNFRWICGSDYCGKWLRQIAEEKNFHVWIKSSTDQLHNVAVQGPKSREVLEHIVWTAKTQTPLSELKWFRSSVGRIGDQHGIPVIVSRTGYSGELGYEVFAHPNDCVAVWDAIISAGEAFGITPLGLNALDMLRIEAGLIFAGYEFCDQTDPFEAGIGFTVPLKTKDEDFVGKQALIARKALPQRVLVGLELSSNELAAHGDGVYSGRQQVGVITSATRSPVLRKNIALCRISVSASTVGTLVEVGKLDGHHKRIKAKVVRFPFYDPEKTRVRM